MQARDCLLVLDLHVAPRTPAGEAAPTAKSAKSKADEKPSPQWVMSVEGSITSPACLGSNSILNVTADAFRVDWEATYNKAINYSLMLTLVCLAQIALLFRQVHL